MWGVAADQTAVDKTAAGRLVAAQAAGRRAAALTAAQAAGTWTAAQAAGTWTAALAADRWTAASAAAWGPQSWATDERASGTITVIITVGFPIT